MDAHTYQGATGRPGPYRELRQRNERRARIAQLLEAQRKHRRSVELVRQLQRAARHGR